MKTENKNIQPIDSYEARKKAHDTLLKLMDSEDEKVRLRASIQYFKLFHPWIIQERDRENLKENGAKYY